MKVKYRTGVRFTAKTRGHEITVDLPADKGGADQGMTPSELLAASLGACIGIYVTQYCKQIGIDPEGTSIEVKWEVAKEPMRLDRIHATVTVPSGIPEERRKAVHKVAEHCMIHQTLISMSDMAIEIV